MINRIIEFCARNRFFVFLFIGAGVLAGLYCIKHITMDAIPDLSDTQVIIYSRWDRSPDIIEDQVTYPIITAMLGVPKVKSIRGYSDFGYSYVYVIFKDGTDLYWARSRTLEYLSNILPRLPKGVKAEMARDETALGWVYEYALVDTTGTRNLAQLRTLQDWYLRFDLEALPGVAEVAPVGGFVKQYQVKLDPNALDSYGVGLNRVIQAVREGNNDVGGGLIEFSGREYMVRGLGYARSTDDIGNIAVGVNKTTGAPILIKNLGQVTLGPEMRRGVTDLNGKGETVGGIVIMRYGESALRVIERVRKELIKIAPTLPAGVKIVPTYDRAKLIGRAIANLKETLIEELTIVSLLILIFLWHIPSAMIPILSIPIAVILAFIPMYSMGLTANIMSLAGIAIAIGAMVDASIVMVEQLHKKLEQWEAEGKKAEFKEIVIGALKEVGSPCFFSLLVIAVAFMPIFTLEAQEGRLFKPLAYTKNFSMAIAAILAITFVPAIVFFLIRTKKFEFRPRFLSWIVNAVAVGTIYSEEQHPISRPLMRLYHPVVEFVLKRPWKIIILAVIGVILTIPVYLSLGSEFMPPLNEGVILYMPTTLPGISVTEASRLLQVQDKILRTFPEVEQVFGKAGRAETATDSAPFSMSETTVTLKPPEEWPKIKRWYSRYPGWVRGILSHVWPDHLTMQQLIYGPGGMDEALHLPGVTNAWTMPIKARVDMLSTGIRTPVGIKIQGGDLGTIQQIGKQMETVLGGVRGTRSVYAERTVGGYFLDFGIKRKQIARFGLSVGQVETAITSAIGGEDISKTIEGRERFPINVRYYQGYRDKVDRLKRVLITAPSGQKIPMTELADIKLVTGPGMIRDENGLLTGYVFVDVTGRDIGSYVEEAQKVVSKQVMLPTGYTLRWSGEYKYMKRAAQRLKVVIPITIFLVLLLLYFNTRSAAKTLIIFLAVPFSAVGAILFLHFLHYNMSVAVWVGLIALLGVDAETGVFMLLYLDLAFYAMRDKGLMKTKENLRQAIIDGAVKRLRPKFMTVAVMFMSLIPIMWSTRTGADVMKRIAAPMIGGIFTSFIMELVVYPAIYELWRWHFYVKKEAVSEQQ
jgi:Cu(I)/Ag(I) efflux system membrane protein CusA/SilA